MLMDPQSLYLATLLNLTVLGVGQNNNVIITIKICQNILRIPLVCHIIILTHVSLFKKKYKYIKLKNLIFKKKKRKNKK
jgi:hypothetical protein